MTFANVEDIHVTSGQGWTYADGANINVIEGAATFQAETGELVCDEHAMPLVRDLADDVLSCTVATCTTSALLVAAENND